MRPNRTARDTCGVTLIRLQGGTTMAARTRSEAPESALVSLAVAAENLGVSVKTIRRRISDGTVRGYRVGRLIRVDLDELRRSLMVEIPTTR
ncbi:excisionase family DNA-binding protein [Microbacterium sp. A204]|uniref:excisionase family DNA-binding protein n=1 Tax=Microbacterium sp. A204 TaxID=3457321 RepID=UPI003FD10CA3